jgi:hypothetical protein
LVNPIVQQKCKKHGKSMSYNYASTSQRWQIGTTKRMPSTTLKMPFMLSCQLFSFCKRVAKGEVKNNDFSNKKKSCDTTPGIGTDPLTKFAIVF